MQTAIPRFVLSLTAGSDRRAQAHQLIEAFGSPLYVYDLNQIEMAYQSFRQAFDYPELEIHYAAVCNLNLTLLQALSDCGAGIHANTPGDAFAALKAGIPAESIMYSGTNLNAEDFAFLQKHQIPLNLDSLDQVQHLLELGHRPAGIGLRLLIDPEHKNNRIGVTVTELKQALALCSQSGVPITGLHMYAGTNNHSEARIVDCFQQCCEASALLPDLKYLNLGGGFGIPYQAGQKPIALESLGQKIVARLKDLNQQRGRTIQLIIEPGRYLVGNSGSLLMQVVSVKERQGRRFVGVDSTVGNIVVPAVYHPYHRIEALTEDTTALDIPTDICGNTTHSRDFLGKNLLLPALKRGDLLWMHDVGAYGYAMSSHFLHRPRPAEVLLKANQAHLIRQRETLEDLLKGQVVQS